MALEQLKRKLAAILAADVAGYSRLMAGDEQATVAALDLARGIFKSRIESNQGRVNDMAGDSVLAVFETATGAVNAALAVQADLAVEAAKIPEERQMRFRIGIHLGDVIEKGDGTVYGDGVNIAARLQSLAESGGVTVSDSVRNAVRGTVPAAFADQGEQRLKNIPEPIRVFRIDIGATDQGSARQNAATPANPALLPAPSDRPSIAVLSFTNMSGDPEQGYFADGMVEDIITALSRFKELFVIARNSSFVYKSRAVDIQQVARELGVRYVLEGSLRKAGNRVRITGQLIDAATRAHLWADSFDGALEDVFDLQDRVTAKVVGALLPSIRQAEIERARRKPPADLVAYDYLLRAMPHVEANAPEEADKGIALLIEALRFDPHYAVAHAYLAHAYEQRWARLGQSADDKFATERHARAAIAHGGDDSHALALGGFALSIIDVEPGLAEGALTRALTLNPNAARALGFAAVFYARRAQADIAIDYAQRAMRLSPLDHMNYGPETALAIAHFARGEFDEAASWARKASETNPRFPVARFWLVVSLAIGGQKARAIEELGRMNAQFPGGVGLSLANLSCFLPRIREPATAAFIETEAALGATTP